MIDAGTEYLTQAGRRVLIGPNDFKTRSPSRLAGGPGKLSRGAHVARMVMQTRSVGMIGADVLDGVYHPVPILRRLKVLQTARRFGADVRVFGSSWSQTPSALVIDFLRAAPWLKLHARDPISQSRMEADLGRPVTLVADVAFLLRPEIRADAAQAHAASQWIAAQQGKGHTVLGVNLSGHTLEGAADYGTGAFSALLSRWLDADPTRSILIMPHDRRAGMVGDMLVLERLHQAMADRYGARMHMLPDTLEAWELKALAGQVDLIMTGRMHLAIAAMGMGTPALCTVYQGKFEGLMAHFGIDGLTVTPQEVLAERCDEQLTAVTENRAELGARIAARLPAIQELSRKNFVGM